MRGRSTFRRFTPTPVGNARVSRSRCQPPTVHPHACGECRCPISSAAKLCGSPPRLWGMPSDQHAQLLLVRFTPTPVGNAGSPCCRATCRPVHPHACGECRLPDEHRRLYRGSPPRLWGMLMAGSGEAAWKRFTPTPVGNAGRWLAAVGAWSVHPHACGECLHNRRLSLRITGSPPRLWGMQTGNGPGATP